MDTVKGALLTRHTIPTETFLEDILGGVKGARNAPLALQAL
jgi:hypothetical protein